MMSDMVSSIPTIFRRARTAASTTIGLEWMRRGTRYWRLCFLRHSWRASMVLSVTEVHRGWSLHTARRSRKWPRLLDKPSTWASRWDSGQVLCTTRITPLAARTTCHRDMHSPFDQPRRPVLCSSRAVARSRRDRKASNTAVGRELIPWYPRPIKAPVLSPRKSSACFSALCQMLTRVCSASVEASVPPIPASAYTANHTPAPFSLFSAWHRSCSGTSRTVCAFFCITLTSCVRNSFFSSWNSSFSSATWSW
mmetsp:Transcript_14538/g.46214  ORF Transcript_14538/g.46214 Transcript_14538/m.46214 type:complete len:252 (-) Transcript_14538:497-1252(-)